MSTTVFYKTPLDVYLNTMWFDLTNNMNFKCQTFYCKVAIEITKQSRTFCTQQKNLKKCKNHVIFVQLLYYFNRKFKYLN